MLEIDQVSFQYPNGAHALKNVSIACPKGESFAILGESGSGKTTLLMCVGRFLRAAKGHISLHETNIWDLPEKEFRQRLGIVFQNLNLFPHLTVLENLSLAPVKALDKRTDPVHEQAAMMLERLGIPETARRYPSEISGGQAQRVAIARALMLEPEYLLLDEPTSALDINTTIEFARWLRDLQEFTTFIIVTHDVAFAEQTAESGVLIEKGEVVERGGIDRILAAIHSSSRNSESKPPSGET